MTTGRAWYVKARRLNGQRKLVSGPFDDHADAYAESARVTPRYPDAHLSVELEVGRSLPVVGPRGPAYDGGYNLRNVAGRLEAADAIATHARTLGATVRVENWDGDPDVDIVLPFLRANIWLAWTPAAPMPIVSWIAGDGLKLRAVLPGAWREGYPHRKATSVPDTWGALFEAIEIGICGGFDGSAFHRED